MFKNKCPAVSFTLFFGVICFLALALPLAAPPPLAWAAEAVDSVAAVKDRGELRVGCEPGFFPFEMKKPNGQWTGFDVEMAQAFAKSLGVKATFLDTRWDGIIPALHTKRFDVILSGMTITPERAQSVLFSDPYFEAGLMLATTPAWKTQSENPSLLNNSSFKIAVKLGTTADLWVKKALPRATLKQFESETDAGNALRLGHVDGFIYDKPFMLLYAKRNHGKVVLNPKAVTTESLAMATRKQNTGLVKAFNEFLKKWKQSGDYQKAYHTHFEEMPWLTDFPALK